jgi:hypothetical protein
MSITQTTASPQHNLHWLAEQALYWSGLPVYLVNHLATMAELHRAGSYDRMSSDVLTLTEWPDYARELPCYARNPAKESSSCREPRHLQAGRCCLASPH